MAAKDTTASQGPPLRFSQKLLSRKMSFALVVGVFLFYVIGIFVRSSQGIRLVLHNESGAILKNATIRFENEKQYSLGEIAPGKTRKLFVISDSKSNIRLNFADPNGLIHSEIVAGYVENGYCGDVTVQVQPDLRVKLLDESLELWNWKSWYGFL
jgi:hypothetical protein